MKGQSGRAGVKSGGAKLPNIHALTFALMSS